jgi:nickel/cobalt exporter
MYGRVAPFGCSGQIFLLDAKSGCPENCVSSHVMRHFLLLASFCSITMLVAHPLGNFSVNHYAKFELGPHRVQMTYAIDLAEIPTFEMLRDWGLKSSSPRDQLDPRAAAQAEAWIKNLSIRVDGAQVEPVFESAGLAIADGAGNLPVMRITAKIRIPSPPGRLEYEDHNFAGRAGWKEIVIAADPARLESSSQGNQDRSHALTAYPPDPLAAPPQDLRAEFVWLPEAPVITSHRAPTAPVIRPIPQPVSKPAPVPAALTAQNAPAGTVIRNDFLSRLLRRDQLPFGMILIALVVAFGLGGAHALTPGHGKTIVAAYLVGSRGTMKHAALLGAMVTFTHTISVFALGAATLFLFRFIVPEKITEILGIVSGLSIFILGAWMLWKRLRHRISHSHHHHHHHHHDHEHHHHAPAGHSHVPDGEITWGSLITLAVSGGLVPCESALVLLLSAIALGRVGLGLLLLLAFSLGLAGVLMATGMAVLYAKRILPKRKTDARNPWLGWIPVGSAAVVTLVGMVLTGVALGWLPAR